MGKKLKLRELIAQVKNGNEEAVLKVVDRFSPLVRKYSRRLGYDDACVDLVLWILDAVYRYEQNTNWGRAELERHLVEASLNDPKADAIA